MECNQKIVIAKKMQKLREEILEITEAKKLFTNSPHLLALLEGAVMRNQEEILVLHFNYSMLA